jgi:hypothetical protein
MQMGFRVGVDVEVEAEEGHGVGGGKGGGVGGLIRNRSTSNLHHDCRYFFPSAADI